METAVQGIPEGKQTLPGQATHILVEVAYDRKLLFDRETGFQFLALLGAGVPVKSAYGEDDKILDRHESLRVELLSQEAVRELFAARLIDPA